MPNFNFVAINGEGKQVSGVRAGLTRHEVISRLRSESLVVTALNAQDNSSEWTVEQRFQAWQETFLLGSVSQATLMVMTRQLAAMLRAGVSLTDSLHTIAHSSSNERLSKVLQKVRTDIQRGRSLTDALRRHPTIFDNLFISIIQAGEASGSLAQNVARLADYLERKENFRRKVKSAMTYPTLVVIFFVFLTTGIFLFVMPRIENIFADYNAELPALTMGMLAISKFLRSYWMIWAPALMGLIVALAVFRKSEGGRRFLDQLTLQIPFFGKLSLEAAVARMAMTLSTLLSNGIPLTDALQLGINSLNNTLLEDGCRKARTEVMKGKGLAESLARVPNLPRLLPRMVRVGEESGTLSEMLEDISKYYDQEVDVTLGRVTSVIEPILIIGMGAIVLVTVLSIYLPIFSLGKAVGGGA